MLLAFSVDPFPVAIRIGSMTYLTAYEGKTPHRIAVDAASPKENRKNIGGIAANLH